MAERVKHMFYKRIVRSVLETGKFHRCFPIILFFVCVFLLSGCAGECISDAGLYNIREGTAKICPNPSDAGHKDCLQYMNVGKENQNKAQKYWVSLALQVKEGDIFEYRVQESQDYSFCHPTCPESCVDEEGQDLCDTPSCRSLDVQFPGGFATADLALLDGDEVLIGLRPALEAGTLNDSVCEGKDERIYPGNYQECVKRRGEPYGGLFGVGTNLLMRKGGVLDKFKVVYSLDDGITSDVGTYEFCRAVVYGENLSAYAADVERLRKRVSGVVLNNYCKSIFESRGENFIGPNDALVEFEGREPVLRMLSLVLQDDHDPNRFSAVCLSEGNAPLDIVRTNILENLGRLPSLSVERERIWGLCRMRASDTFPYRLTVVMNKFFQVRQTSSRKVIALFLPSDRYHTSGSGLFKLKVSRKCFNPGADAVKVYISDRDPDFKPSNDSGDSFVLPNTSFQIARSGSVYIGITDPRGDDKAESRGYISLHYRLRQEAGVRSFSRATNYLKSKIMRILYNRTVDEYGRFTESFDAGGGAVGMVYNAIAGSTLTKVVQASIVLFMVIYGLAFLFGLVKTPQADLVIFLLKLGIVAVLFTPNSWKFFNENLFQLFVEGSAQLINYFSGNGSGTDFAFLDRVLSPFSTHENWMRIFSFFFSGGLGILYFIVILVGLCQIVSSVLKIIVAYIMSLVMVALLLCLAPIFISMIFFKRTKSIFDNWIKNLAQVSVTPVITFAAFAVLAEVGLGIIYALFNFQICPACVIEPDLGLVKFCLLAVYLPSSYDAAGGIMIAQNGGGMPVGIGLVISFLVLSNAIVAFTSRAAILSSSIFGAIASDATIPAEQFMDSMKAIVGQDSQTQYQRRHMRYIKELDGEKDEPRKMPEQNG